MTQPAGQVYACQHPGCFISLTPQITKTDKNGNQGKAFISCIGSLDAPHRQFFSFLAHNPTPLGQLTTHPPSQVPSSGDLKCSVQGCTSNRINIKCARTACARHCRELGGCGVNQHRVAAPGPLLPMLSQPSSSGLFAAPLLSLIEQPTPLAFAPAERSVTPLLSASEPHPQQLSSPLPSTVPTWDPQREPPTSLNPLPNPRFASQMKPVFTEQIAREQSIQESRRLREEQRLHAIKKMKHTVNVCAWLSDNEPPEESVFQEDFVYPNFCLSASVLADSGFESLGDNAWFHLYNHTRSSWQRVKVGHITSVLARSDVLVKAINVKTCLGIDRYLSPASEVKTPPHFRENLRGERASVAMKLADEFLLAHPSTPSLSTQQSLKAPRQAHSGRAAPLLLPAKCRHHRDSYPSSSFASPSLPSTSKAPNVIELTDSASDDDSDSEETFFMSKAPKRLKLDLPTIPSSAPQRQWPADFDVEEVIDVIEKCSAPPPGSTIPEYFETITHVPFKSSTFYEAKGRWRHAKQDERDLYLGCKWSAFANRVPLPRTKIKTARQRVKRRIRGGESDGGAGDWSD